MTSSDIEKIIKQNGYKLLGEILVSDEDYKDLRIYTYNMISRVNDGMRFQSKAYDLKLSLGLTQLAIRNYDRSLWRDIDTDLGTLTTPANQSELGKLYLNTIRHYGLFEVGIDGTNKYVENIKANAYVTNRFLSGWYEFWEAYYEHCLFRQIDDFNDEDVQALREFMQESLRGNSSDSISVDSIKAKKSYRLLRSTRRVLAECDGVAVHQLVEITLKMIDDYYYDDIMPDGKIGRFEHEFINWCKTKERNNIIRKRKHKERRLVSHSPYLYVDIGNENASLIIPRQRFRKGEINGVAYCTVIIDGNKNVYQLELTESFGMYTSTELELPVDDIFSRFKIVIDRKPETVIRATDYRIFVGRKSSKHLLKDKDCDILLKKTCIFNLGTNEIDVDEGYDNWNVVSIIPDENTIIRIGTMELTINGNHCDKPLFTDIIKGLATKTMSGDDIIAVKRHPTMNFSLSKPQLERLVVTINGDKYFWSELSCVSEIGENSNDLQISVDLNNLLYLNDDVYNVMLDIPGVGNKQYCKYVLLNDFKIVSKKQIYKMKESVSLVVEKKIQLNTDNEKVTAMVKEDKTVFTYILSEKTKTVRFRIELGIPVYIDYTAPVVMFGFSKETITAKHKWIWYTDLENELYFSLPGIDVKSVSIRMKDGISCRAELIDGDVYKCDIYCLKEKMEELGSDSYHIVAECCDKKWIELFMVYYKVVPEPYFLIEKNDNGKITMNIERLTGNATLYVDIKDSNTDEKCINGQQLHKGENNLDGLDEDGVYDILPYMIEDYGLFGAKRTDYKIIRGTCCFDKSDLRGWGFYLEQIKYNRHNKGTVSLVFSETYVIIFDEKSSRNSYKGKILVKDKGLRIRCFSSNAHIYIKRMEGKLLYTTISIMDINDNTNKYLYYDRVDHRILRHDNPKLEKKRVPCIDLNDKNTEFVLKLSKKWRDR